MTDEFVPDLVLDDNHFLRFTRWAPDDLLANHEWLGIPSGEPLPVIEKWGAMIRHYKPDGEMCEGAIEFDGEWQRRVHKINTERAAKEGREPPKFVAWTVESWEPLTCSPSVLCLRCNDHGFIRNGKWVKA